MKAECAWFNSNLEAYFSETLGRQRERASTHLEGCASCRAAVDAMSQKIAAETSGERNEGERNEIDPLVRQAMKYRMAAARRAARPTRGVALRLGLAGASVALVAAMAFLLIRETTTAHLPVHVPESAESPAAPEAAPEVKGPSTPVLRAKPAGLDTSSPAPVSTAPRAVTDGAPDFLVTDSSGYSSSLQDYRGRALILGVWSGDQPEGARNLQRLYQAFGTRKDLRIIGVSRRQQDRIAGTTFPVAYNSGSRLLDTADSNFVLIDKDGRELLRGTLTGDPKTLQSKVKSVLDQLGAR